MSCESLLFTANTAAQTVAAATTPTTATPLNIGTIVRRRKFKCHPDINVSGSAITITGGDYFSVEGMVTITLTAAGTVTVWLLQDGAVVSSQTVTATAAASVPVPILGEVRSRGCATNLTVVVTGDADSATNLYLRVKED